MDEPQDEASRLNNEARKLFSDGKFEKAGRLYEAAHKADTTKSPIYLSNLALVQLKLEQFRKAEKTATKALVCNPRFTKARYRRATSRWRQGRPMDALVDLASVLTSEPTDKAAASMFAEISSEIEALGSNRSYYRPMTILIADFPSAYGSSTVPRPTRDESPNKFVVPNKSERIPKELRAGTCASCKTVKWMREVKTCRQCSSVVYCNERCQRKHWPTHKKDCVPYEDEKVRAIHLCKGLMDHKFICNHLIFYAMRSIGALHHSSPPYLFVLLVFVKMVPVASGEKRKRLSIANLVTAPLAVFGEDVRDSYVKQLQQMRETCEMPSAPGVAIIVTALGEKTLESQKDFKSVMGIVRGKGRDLIFMHRVVPELVLMITEFSGRISFESHSFGVGRRATSDLDELYWNLEDELANDAKNYYGLQG